jgi:hypothetical protein
MMITTLRVRRGEVRRDISDEGLRRKVRQMDCCNIEDEEAGVGMKAEGRERRHK